MAKSESSQVKQKLILKYISGVKVLSSASSVVMNREAQIHV